VLDDGRLSNKGRAWRGGNSRVGKPWRCLGELVSVLNCGGVDRSEPDNPATIHRADVTTGRGRCPLARCAHPQDIEGNKEGRLTKRKRPPSSC